MGVLDLESQVLSEVPEVSNYILSDFAMPDYFDARTQWPNCKTINQIRDQGSCGSCWAFGATEAFSDRFCIASNGKINLELSPADLLSCCKDCGNGCLGGLPSKAWNYFKTYGVVSGGLYGTHHTCQPYEFEPCEHHMTGQRPQCVPPSYTPSCSSECDPKYNGTYMEDKYYASSSYRLPKNVKQIQLEILQNGPVEASMIVYEDFHHYRSGK